MGRRGGAFLFVAATGLVAAPAYAQIDNFKPVQQVDLSLDLRHDSNVARADAVGATLRGLTRKDERATVGANLIVARALGRNTVELNAFVGYDFYRKNTQLNRERIGIAGEVGINAGPCNLKLTPDFQRRQSELADTAILYLPGIDSVRNTQTVQLYRGELRCGRANGLRPMVLYQRSSGDNSNVVRQVSDYRGERYGGGISYSNATLGTFDLAYERESIDYPKRDTLIPGALVGYRLEEYKLTASRNIGRILVAHGYVARTRLRPRNVSAQAFKGLSWNVGGTITPTDQLVINGSFGRSITPSLGSDALYSRNREIMLDATYYLSGKTTLVLAASRQDRDYTGGTDLLGPLLADDRLERISGRANFRANQRMGFGLEVGWERRNADALVYDYRNTFVALHTTFSLGAR